MDLGCWFAPSLVEVEACCLLPLGEVELVVGLYPSSVRWIGYCLAKGLPLLCEGVFVLREEFGTPLL